MIKKGRVHGSADTIIPSKRKGQIAHSTTDMYTRQGFFNGFGCIDICFPILVVFFNASSYSKNIGIKNDVLWWETNFIYKYIISSFTDFHFTLISISLPFFIKGHNNDGGAVFTNKFCLSNKLLFALF